MIILGTNSIKETGFNVANSCRFNDASDDNLTRTFSAQTTRTKHSISFWCKRATLGHTQFLFEGTGGTYPTQIYFSSGDILALYDAGENATYSTIAKFRDPSAWMHVLCRIDTTQASNENRVRFYVNGVLSPTSQSNSISQSTNVSIGKNGTHTIGKRGGASDSFDGYLCEFIYVYNVSHEPTDFGEFDSDSGIWKPLDGLADSLTFGNNGFYLDFQDSSALGNDVSGNNTDFTANNLTAIDQSTDTCTNNACTWNILYRNSATFTQGNLVYQAPSSNPVFGSITTFGVNSGKWYAECKYVSGSNHYGIIGICDEVFATLGDLGSATNTDFGKTGSALGSHPSTCTVAYVINTGKIRNNNNNQNYGSGGGDGDIINIALDRDNRKVYFGINGTYENSGNPSSGSNGFDLSSQVTGDTYFLGVTNDTGSSETVLDFNFGGGFGQTTVSSGNTDGNGYGNFEYAVPSGYYALNTKNLAEYG